VYHKCLTILETLHHQVTIDNSPNQPRLAPLAAGSDGARILDDHCHTCFALNGCRSAQGMFADQVEGRVKGRAAMRKIESKKVHRVVRTGNHIELAQFERPTQRKAKTSAVDFSLTAVHASMRRVVPAKACIMRAQHASRRQIARMRRRIQIAMRRVVINRERHGESIA
jgi:hypothetical protein